VDTRAPAELARAISDVDPERPSIAVLRRKEKRDDGEIGALLPEAIGRTREGSAAKLRRRLAGDLDNIALKALRKQPQRRYGSVEQLAEDIRRHLEGLPVTARKDSWSYRAGKFIRRHKVGVAATALLALAVLGGLAAILHEARIAEANRRQAEKRFSDVRKLANSLMFEIHDSIRELPGSTPARKLLVSRALEYLDSLNQQAKGDASLQKELAAAYERMGDVLGYPYYANLGDTPGALQSFQKAAVIRESLVAARPDDAQLQMELAATYFRIANVLESTGDFGAALQMVHKALPITQRIASGSNDPALADQLAGGYYYTAGLLGQTGDPVGALENYRKAASVREAALQANHQSVPLRTHLAADYGGIALSMRDQGDLVQAIQMQAKAVGILEELARARPDNTTRREFWAEAVNRFATFRKDHGEAVAALQAFRQAHQIFGELLSADPKNSLARVNYGFSGNGIAESLIALGKPAAALRILREEVVTFEEMSPGAANNRYVRTGLAMSYSGLGRAHSALASEPHLSAGEMQKRWGEARSWYEKGLAVWIDKEKRGELESDERKEPQIVTQEIARCEMEIAKTESPGKR
jgi:non-specific serine/threonine protein kinase/serine/threonine-protein kinase